MLMKIWKRVKGNGAMQEQLPVLISKQMHGDGLQIPQCLRIVLNTFYNRYHCDLFCVEKWYWME